MWRLYKLFTEFTENVLYFGEVVTSIVILDPPALSLRMSGFRNRPLNSRLSYFIFFLPPSNKAELMSGFIEFCVELKSASEGAAAAEMDGEVSLSQQPGGQEERSKNGRGGRRGMLHRQGSVVCSRVQSLNTISYVDDGEGQTCLTAVLSFLEVAPSVPFYSVRDFFQPLFIFVFLNFF